MLASAFVSLIESTGTFIAATRYGSATHVPSSVLSRGAAWLGIGILMDGLWGTGTGSTASVENVGLLAVTKVGSRRVVQMSAGFMFFFFHIRKIRSVCSFYTFANHRSSILCLVCLHV